MDVDGSSEVFLPDARCRLEEVQERGLGLNTSEEMLKGGDLSMPRACQQGRGWVLRVLVWHCRCS